MDHVAFFLVGPTATGKTAVAQWIAEHHGYDVLSADSMLVYAGMDIGTAKPTSQERSRVRYWGIDLVPPTKPFSVGRFLDTARECFESAADRGVPVIVAGGTGLYIKALTVGIDEGPVASEDVRTRARRLLQDRGVEGLAREVQMRNPAWFEAIPDKANSRRLLRSLELIEAGWTAPPQRWRDPGKRPTLVGLTMDRAVLEQRITARVERMYAEGLLEETRRLLHSGLREAPTASQAVGYAEAVACVEGRTVVPLAMERTIQRTRQLAKRQMTWFRHQAMVEWIDAGPAEPVEDTAARVMACWRRHGPAQVIV